MRHAFGLVLFIVLTAALYWVWEDGMDMALRLLRGSRFLRSSASEFAPMIYFLFVCVLLGVAQVIWDKVTGQEGHD